jgi:hypothetical protein
LNLLETSNIQKCEFIWSENLKYLKDDYFLLSKGADDDAFESELEIMDAKKNWINQYHELISMQIIHKIDDFLSTIFPELMGGVIHWLSAH